MASDNDAGDSQGSSEDEHHGPPTSNDPAERRKYWLKKEVAKKKDRSDSERDSEGSGNDEDLDRNRKKKKPKEQKIRNYDEVGQARDKQIEILPENIGKKLREIVENRSKRSSSWREYYETLTKILEMLQDEIQRLEVFKKNFTFYTFINL